MTLASTYGIEVLPHGLSFQVNAQVSFAHNAVLVPMMEYLDSFNHLTQYFIKQPMIRELTVSVYLRCRSYIRNPE